MAKQGSKGISWTDETWNIIAGCSYESEGCRNCWAKRQALRVYPDLAYFCDGQARWNGNVRIFPERLDYPLRWTKKRLIAVGLMGDLFHPGVPDEFIEEVFAVMAISKHTFQILTKRPERMLKWMSGEWRDTMIEGRAQKRWHDRTKEDPSLWLAVHLPLPNVWIGVSCENQEAADQRIPILMRTPAALRYVSFEPLLGSITINRSHAYCPTHDFGGGFCVGGCHDLRKPEWVIFGGESGPGSRPMHPEWARDMIRQCESLGVPVHFKQWGDWAYWSDRVTVRASKVMRLTIKGNNGSDLANSSDGGDVWLYKCGKKHAGRIIDGKEYLRFPEVKKYDK